MEKWKIIFSLSILSVCSYQIKAQAIVADSLFNAKEWKQAAIAYNNYLKTNPKDKPGFQYNKIGQCYYNLKQFENAIDAFKKSVAYNGNSGIMYNIACAYSLTSQIDSALNWLDNSATAGYASHQSTLDDNDLNILYNDGRFKTITDKIKKNEKPCSFQIESQQFNFWIGEWIVYNVQGQQTGTSKIEQILGECVIQENWTDFFGNKGKSFNFYNSNIKQWQQTWVDDKGGNTEFINGKYFDNAMHFQSSRQVINNGKDGIRRLTFYNVNKDEVRQLGEISFDNEKTWIIEYDLKYLRKQSN